MRSRCNFRHVDCLQSSNLRCQLRLVVNLYQVAMIMTDGPNRACRWT